MKLIGIAGAKGSGKDTLANLILTYSPGYRKYSMADPIRTVGRIMGFTDEEMLDPVKKEQAAEFLGISWRKFAQWFGTDIMRDYLNILVPHEHQIWVRLAERYFDHSPGIKFIIPDIRFDDEADMIRRRNGAMILVKGRTTGIDIHKSEKGISPELIDIVVNNTSTIEELEKVTEHMVRNGFQPVIPH
jgi:hypothetical protein